MEETDFSMDALYEKAKEYTDTTLELARLKATDKAAGFIGALVPQLLMLLFLLLFLFCANVALGLWLGALLGTAYYGFLAVAGFYLLLAALIRFALKETLRRRIANAFIANMLS